MNRTLRLTGFKSDLVLRTILFVCLFTGALEGLVRLDLFQSVLTTPQMGSRHYQLGQKLAFLDRVVEANGSIDCVMIGSSMVDVGFDPDAFRAGYQEISGREIQCFNFGVDASSAASTHAVAKIIAEDYHPRLLIIGTDPRDYVLPHEDPDVAVVLDSPWVQYRLGKFSLEGWLFENSYLYRYLQHLNRLMRFNLTNTLLKDTEFTFPMLPNGHTPISQTNTRVNDPPDPNDPSFENRYYRRIFSSYQILDLNVDAMKQTLTLNGPDMQVLVVEMPVTDGFYSFFGNGEKDYEKFVQRVSRLTRDSNVPFWRTEPLGLIPDNVWSDYSHLNAYGSQLFSVWLGREVAQAEIDGTLLNPGE